MTVASTRDRLMLFQFCLYGFLKNQQYFEPFFLLALLQKFESQGATLALTWVGLLYGFRDLCVNLLEVPSGAIADVLGRRRSMIAGFVAYIGSFLIFGFCEDIWTLFVAMFLFSVGQAFRTGTHKSMIFEWLNRLGRTDEKTAIYGYTRSWSKLGSALSALIAAALVFTTGNYSTIFLVCVGPYLLNVVNFMFYPSYLEGKPVAGRSLGEVFRTLGRSIQHSLAPGPLRRLLFESMGFEGLYRAGKDYLQLIVQVAAIGLLLPYLIEWLQQTRPGADPKLLATTVAIGPVYFLVFVASSIASRKAKNLVQAAGSENAAGRRLWIGNLAVFSLLGFSVMTDCFWLAILAFLALAILENLWRPILVSRIADCTNSRDQATILSVESQAKSLFAAFVAPLLGFAIDMLRQHSTSGEYNYLPLALFGIAISLVMLLTGRRKRRQAMD
ncbi:MAG: MFS transporter [Deltaproteobacteria bacterium]|nr:MFS transporter [Deltaproteobacteria bacterium]